MTDESAEGEDAGALIVSADRDEPSLWRDADRNELARTPHDPAVLAPDFVVARVRGEKATVILDRRTREVTGTLHRVSGRGLRHPTLAAARDVVVEARHRTLFAFDHAGEELWRLAIDALPDVIVSIALLPRRIYGRTGDGATFAVGV